jgi:hypothetical protein
MTGVRRSRRRASSGFPGAQPVLVRAGLITLGILALMLAGVWIMTLQRDLPGVRAPRDPSSSEVLPGRAVLPPGSTLIHSVDAELEGDWVTQQIGESDWLATDLEGSGLRAAFYGTEIYLTVRVGPDASLAYVAIDNQPLDHLPDDEFGSYLSLWAGQASDRSILLASNLAHGEHIVDVVAGGDGELAISGFTVEASTPLPWAFVFAYAGVALGIFALLRSILFTVHRESSAVLAGRPDASSNSAHTGR